MIDELPLRTWLAVAVALATAAVVYVLSGSGQAALASLAGGAALLAIVATMDEPETPAEPVPLPAGDTDLAHGLEGLADPALLIRGGRVVIANRAARALLGDHVVGEDARVAIRHPGAAEHLADAARGETRAIDLVGLGGLDERWQMRGAGIGADTLLVHLANRTGEHAAERMRVDFVANASHELRTPLASILGYVETLQDAAGDEPAVRNRFLGIVFDEARRMERLVEDLMSLSRIEADKFRLPATQVDVAALAREVCATLSTTHGDRGGDIVLAIDADVPAVTGDAAQLSQLLHNLVGNAMKYGRAGTPVRVSMTRGDDVACLRVADEGDGIPPEHLPRLTERFYRVDPGRSRSLGGTGLGLAIVKHIVERHRGRLDIASEPGVGTRVTVALPAAAPPAVSGAAVMKA
ncbi:ATPase [Sphingomonas sp. Leaf412]|uniref:sensor histidine kinase n=1 Tax=Sphingomonas sp. Leaf412 TaxID=1736370 RepID=UPI0006F6BCD5|nr:ATP-binding protein [Sphingomonas sp. Leaf412]KQT31874.1 ATPase [Sphingomonas sp. Leaf412]